MTHILTRVELCVHARVWHHHIGRHGAGLPQWCVESVCRLLVNLPDASGGGGSYNPEAPGGMKARRVRPGAAGLSAVVHVAHAERHAGSEGRFAPSLGGGASCRRSRFGSRG